MSKQHSIQTRQKEGQTNGQVTFYCSHCKKEAATQQALEAVACLNETTGQLPFWSDDFDMDLLALFPQLPNLIEDVADLTLWTFGGESFTRLNHPSVWNMNMGPVAMFWINKPAIQPDDNGWYRLPGGMTTDRPLIEATWLEVLRDAWPHSFIVMCDGEPLWNTYGEDFRRVFDAIMWHIRGHQETDKIQHLKSLALTWVMDATERFKSLLERQAAGPVS